MATNLLPWECATTARACRQKRCLPRSSAPLRSATRTAECWLLLPNTSWPPGATHVFTLILFIS